MVILRAAVVSLCIGLSGCLNLRQSASPMVQAFAPTVSGIEANDDFDDVRVRPPRSHRQVRGGIDPLNTLERPVARANAAEPPVVARRSVPGPAAASATLAAAGPAPEAPASGSASLEAARMLHERNSEEQRRRDHEVEVYNRRITGAICSRC